MARLKAKEIALLWKEICSIYDNSRDTTPEITMTGIIHTIGLEGALETFAAITQLKKSDGRIYGKNREEMEKIDVDPIVLEWSHNNPIRDTDHIHTSHINQLITELLKVRDEK